MGWGLGAGLGRAVVHDDHPKGDLSVSDVIKYSSNIGAAKLAFLLEAERTTSYLREFGFGRYTGLDFPGETRGIMSSPKHIKPIELATTAFGQGVTSNTLQLAYALATLGNDGVRMQPRLVREDRVEHGEINLSDFPFLFEIQRGVHRADQFRAQVPRGRLRSRRGVRRHQRDPKPEQVRAAVAAAGRHGGGRREPRGGACQARPIRGDAGSPRAGGGRTAAVSGGDGVGGRDYSQRPVKT